MKIKENKLMRAITVGLAVVVLAPLSACAGEK